MTDEIAENYFASTGRGPTQGQGADINFSWKLCYSSSLPRHPEAQHPPSPKVTAQGSSGFVQPLCCLEGNKAGIFFACPLIQSANIPHTKKLGWEELSCAPSCICQTD